MSVTATKIKPVARQTKTVPLSVLIDQMDSLREQRRVIAAEDTRLKAEYDAIDIQLVAAIKNQGVQGVRGSTHTASIQVSVQFAIEDFDAYMAFLAKKKMWTGVQRRVGVEAIREFVELSGVLPPGLTRYDKEVISLRKNG
jgi:hypothetical protein